MTEQELAKIEARAAKATPGPWQFYLFLGHEDWHHIEGADGAHITGNYDYEEGGICSTPDDAAFLVAARQDVPRLVNEIRALQALLVEMPMRHHIVCRGFGLVPPFRDCICGLEERMRRWHALVWLKTGQEGTDG